LDAKYRKSSAAHPKNKCTSRVFAVNNGRVFFFRESKHQLTERKGSPIVVRGRKEERRELLKFIAREK